MNVRSNKDSAVLNILFFVSTTTKCYDSKKALDIVTSAANIDRRDIVVESR